MTRAGPLIRLLEKGDIPAMAQAFKELGWNKPASQYERYFMEQVHGTRNVLVAFIEGKFAGYLTICWSSTYPPFYEAKIPERRGHGLRLRRGAKALRPERLHPRRARIVLQGSLSQTW